MLSIADPLNEIGWIDETRPEIERWTGYDMVGWPAAVWLLHAMYENPDVSAEVSHDERHRWRVEQGAEPPVVVGGVNLDDMTTVSGGSSGFAARPGAPWQRLPWSDYAHRLGIELGEGLDVPPCFRWFPHASWPVSIDPPPEGSLDEETLDGLIATLADHSERGAETLCIASYAVGASSDWKRELPEVFRGPLRAIPDFVQGNQPRQFTPTNIWPIDRSWFVYSDYDLWTTKVSGSAELIADLWRHPDLELLTWPPSTS